MQRAVLPCSQEKMLKGRDLEKDDFEALVPFSFLVSLLFAALAVVFILFYCYGLIEGSAANNHQPINNDARLRHHILNDMGKRVLK